MVIGQENLNFKIGRVNSPLVADGYRSSLEDIDPAVFAIIDFFSNIIKIHCQDRWDLEVAACGRSDLIGNIIAQSIPYDPLPIKEENEWRLPLLSVISLESSYESQTRYYYNIQRELEVMYMLPPLQSEQMERLAPFLTHIERVIADRLMHGKDDQYYDGDPIWLAAGIESISLNKSNQEKVIGHKGSLQTSMFYPSISFSLTVIERRNAPDCTNFEQLEEISMIVDIADC